MITSGCTSSTQYAYAEMLKAACDGRIDFVADTRVYAERAERMKRIFLDNGFHIVYDRDVSRRVGDGFFFTLGYGDMSSGQLLKEPALLRRELHKPRHHGQPAVGHQGLHVAHARGAVPRIAAAHGVVPQGPPDKRLTHSRPTATAGHMNEPKTLH